MGNPFVYQDVFGGANIYPSDVTYGSIVLNRDTGNVVYNWPLESAPGINNLLPRILEVTCESLNGTIPWTITMPNAELSGLGQTTLFVSKLSQQPFNVLDAGGGQLINIMPGTSWQIYLIDNTTPPGQWSFFQYGAQATGYISNFLAGPGLTAYNSQLATANPVTNFPVAISSYSANLSDRAMTFVFNSSSGIFALPSSTLAANNWFVSVRNQGTGIITITPSLTAGDRINDISTLNLNPGDSATIITDGAGNFYTVGFGRATLSNFDFYEITLYESGANQNITNHVYTLPLQYQNRISYNFVGTLTANTTIVVPPYIQQYWVSNNTSGNFSLIITTVAAVAQQTLPNTDSAIYYCDGNTVISAENTGISLPLQIAQGGTGGTTPITALSSLGGGTTGIAVFNSLTNVDVITALGGPAAVNSILGSPTYGDLLAFSIALG